MLNPRILCLGIFQIGHLTLVYFRIHDTCLLLNWVAIIFLPIDLYCISSFIGGVFDNMCKRLFIKR